MMVPLVVLVTDRIYVKTRRHIKKVQACLPDASLLTVACVTGFPNGLSLETILDLVADVFTGSVQHIANLVKTQASARHTCVRIVALNQSAILPAIALQNLLGLPLRSGFIESCDKRRMRRLLAEHDPDLAIEYSEAIPGEPGSANNQFVAPRFVVKPAFGMSSSDVRFFSEWTAARSYGESYFNSKEWVPSNVVEALTPRIGRSDMRLIEPYIEGTEFSIDGWILGGRFEGIVQHKLCMVQRTFIGDGPTVSPPLRADQLSGNWVGLHNTEEEILHFGRRVLEGLGFVRGVFHIEARESADHILRLIEVNPRAPGGSLWKSALLRSGYDLELVDAAIQIHGLVPPPSGERHRYVMHYPFYACCSGRLVDWCDLVPATVNSLKTVTVDIVAQINDVFLESDLYEEPYLAFAVAHAENVEDLLETCQTILHLKPPTIVPILG